jgi:two-component system nitrogen regulation sensor histidine kinase NtrY
MGASAPAVASGSMLSPDSINDSETPAVPEVCLRWDADSTHVVIVVEDNGRGIANLANAFVPFYTTKPEGSGIGLVLSRQIAEGHGGRLEIRNRDDQPGCRVLVVLPRSKSKLVADDV